MKRSWITLVAGLVLALLGYFGFYFLGTARFHSLEKGPEPALIWLKNEFHLADPEFARICEMHEAYVSGCAERCRRIDEKNRQLHGLLAATNTVTAEIEKTLLDAAQLRAECQKEMLQHFFQVSQTMPPEQGKRYLAWIQAQTILSDSHQQMQPSPVSRDHGRHN